MTKIKLITKNSQIVPGMVVNLYDKETKEKRESSYKVRFVNDGLINDDYFLPEKNGGCFYYELVSYPPCRPVTWEWVKENIDQVPGLKFRCYNRSYKIINVSSKGFTDEDDDYWEYGADYVYIDPRTRKFPR